MCSSDFVCWFPQDDNLNSSSWRAKATSKPLGPYQGWYFSIDIFFQMFRQVKILLTLKMLIRGEEYLYQTHYIFLNQKICLTFLVLFVYYAEFIREARKDLRRWKKHAKHAVIFSLFEGQTYSLCFLLFYIFEVFTFFKIGNYSKLKINDLSIITLIKNINDKK